MQENVGPVCSGHMNDKTVKDQSGEDATLPHLSGTASTPLMVGELLLGRYRVVGELGRGGMGVVYRCHDDLSGVDMALKTIPAGLAYDVEEMDKVRTNFQLVHKLHHPHIASIHILERDPASGNYFLMMEFVEGENLRQFQQRWNASTNLSFWMPLFKQIASALTYAHQQGVVHRDVKPGNIFVQKDGTVKLLDFGLAGQVKSSLAHVTQRDVTISGTLTYMPPEQWRGQAESPKSDQYAFAVTIYNLLVGRCPFENSSIAVLRETVLNETPVRPSHLSFAVWRVLRKALSKQTKDRYESCAHFVEALERSVNNRRSLHRAVAMGSACLILTGVVGFLMWKLEKRTEPVRMDVTGVVPLRTGGTTEYAVSKETEPVIDLRQTDMLNARVAADEARDEYVQAAAQFIKAADLAAQQTTRDVRVEEQRKETAKRALIKRRQKVSEQKSGVQQLLEEHGEMAKRAPRMWKTMQKDYQEVIHLFEHDSLDAAETKLRRLQERLETVVAFAADFGTGVHEAGSPGSVSEVGKLKLIVEGPKDFKGSLQTEIVHNGVSLGVHAYPFLLEDLPIGQHQFEIKGHDLLEAHGPIMTHIKAGELVESTIRLQFKPSVITFDVRPARARIAVQKKGHRRKVLDGKRFTAESNTDYTFIFTARGHQTMRRPCRLERGRSTNLIVRLKRRVKIPLRP